MDRTGPGPPLFEDAAANFVRRSPAAVDARLVDRGPLFLTLGAEARAVPLKVTRGGLRPVPQSGSDTSSTFEGRGHSLTIDSGWRNIADMALTWLEKKGF